MIKLFKITFVSVLLLVCFKTSAQAYKRADSTTTTQFLSSKSSILKTSLFNILWGTIPITSELYLKYETRLSPNTSIAFGASFLGKNIAIPLIDPTFTTSFQNNSFLGFRVQLDYRYYFSKLNYSLFGSSRYKYAPYGFYIGPNINYSQLEINQKPTPSNSNYINVQQFYATINGGIQVDIFNLITTDIFLGVGYKDNQWIQYKNGVAKTYIYEANNGNYYSSTKIFIGWNVGIPLR